MHVYRSPLCHEFRSPNLVRVFGLLHACMACMSMQVEKSNPYNGRMEGEGAGRPFILVELQRKTNEGGGHRPSRGQTRNVKFDIIKCRRFRLIPMTFSRPTKHEVSRLLVIQLFLLKFADLKSYFCSLCCSGTRQDEDGVGVRAGNRY